VFRLQLGWRRICDLPGMTLTFALTVLTIWCLVSIPVSLLLASMMRVASDAAGGDIAGTAEPVLRETA
jgi:hypothetical protein